MSISIKVILFIIAGLLIIIAILAVVEILKFNQLISVGKEVVARSKAFSSSIDQPQKHILVAGDSTAVGTGAQDPKQSVAGRLASDFPQADITNIGINGLKVRGLVAQLNKLPVEKKFDLALLQIGGNDVVRLTSLSAIERDLTTAISKSKDRAHTVVIMTSGNVGLAPALGPVARYVYNWRTRQVRELFIRVCNREQVVYVDLFRETKDDIFATDVNRYYAEDYFHPSGDGYGVWYQSLSVVLRQNNILFD